MSRASTQSSPHIWGAPFSSDGDHREDMKRFCLTLIFMAAECHTCGFLFFFLFAREANPFKGGYDDQGTRLVRIRHHVKPQEALTEDSKPIY